MANLKEIRVRIQSVKSTRQITSAMKMVSAAKLRKAQDAIIQMRPYANKLHEILESLTASLDNESGSIFSRERDLSHILLVVVTSNRGLCGAFNSNIAKKVIQVIEDEYSEFWENETLEIMSIGKKGSDFLRSKGYEPVYNLHEMLDVLNLENVIRVISDIMEQFVSGKYDRIELFYNQFKNAANQELIREQFLPVPQKEKPEDQYEVHLDFILEPTKQQIIDELIPKSLKIQFYKMLLDSNASEHGARMTAMHKATDNATDLLRELQLNYNKARQSAITKEILEIVSGAEALKG
ncbi:MAG: ATP synthase F1 subunit gamma [Bacteroidales bacterium]|nr:ATP synthase F1 subunit gamma [Bacteroidales bacterium]